MRRTILLITCLALAACGGGDEQPDVPTRTVTGVVTEVGIGSMNEVPDQVVDFTVETETETISLFIDPSVDYGFDLHHLSEHEETGDPVRVRIEDRGGIPYALRIDDA